MSDTRVYDKRKAHAGIGSEIGSRTVSRQFAASRLRRMRKLGAPSVQTSSGGRIYQLQGHVLSYAVMVQS